MEDCIAVQQDCSPLDVSLGGELLHSTCIRLKFGRTGTLTTSVVATQKVFVLDVYGFKPVAVLVIAGETPLCGKHQYSYSSKT